MADAAPKLPQLISSVLTSSSVRRLADFMAEVRAVSNVHHFDLYVLRDTDVRELRDLRPAPPDPLVDKRSATQIMGDGGNRDIIRKWIEEQFRGRLGSEVQAPKIAALATYFPEISSRDPGLRLAAQNALCNTVLLACELAQEIWHGVPVIEIVCGTRLDACLCAACVARRGGPKNVDLIFRSKDKRKIELLFESLRNVTAEVKKQFPERKWHIALELEPGATYLLRNTKSIRKFVELLMKDENESLRPHVGFNFDVAHMKIAKVELSDLPDDFRRRVVHAHLADHPFMHTRDHVVGTWTPIDRYNGNDYPYLKFLAERLTDPEQTLSFSGAVALELEGCNRIGWVHQSLHGMRQLFDVVKNHPAKIGV